MTVSASFILGLVFWSTQHVFFFPHGGGLSCRSLKHDRRSVLVLMTTHFSFSHQRFLQICWPAVLAYSRMLREADVLVVSTGGNSTLHQGLVRKVFEVQGVCPRFVSYINPGYQQGANLAFCEGLANGWFDGYEWVVRLNPDVIVRNDSWLLSKMSETAVHGIFVNCQDSMCNQTCLGGLIHSDFFMFRPNRVNVSVMTKLSHITNAERKVTAFFQQIVAQGADRWVPGTQQGGSCRVRGAASPIIHDHNYESCMPGKT